MAPLFLAMIQDARRFILYNRSIIEKAPLQVYASALMFSPKISLIRRQFLSQGPMWIKRWPDVEENWSPTLQTLEGHSGSVQAVAFSPDGRRLITDLDSIDPEIRPSDSSKTMSWPSYSLSKDQNWIICKGHSVLWLPSEYRPICQIFRDNVLAMGHSSGRVTIITFDLDHSLI